MSYLNVFSVIIFEGKKSILDSLQYILAFKIVFASLDVQHCQVLLYYTQLCCSAYCWKRINVGNNFGGNSYLIISFNRIFIISLQNKIIWFSNRFSKELRSRTKASLVMQTLVGRNNII